MWVAKVADISLADMLSAADNVLCNAIGTAGQCLKRHESSKAADLESELLGATERAAARGVIAIRVEEGDCEWRGCS